MRTKSRQWATLKSTPTGLGILAEAKANALEAEYQAVLARASAAEAHTAASAATYWWPVGSFGSPSGFQCRKVHRPCEIGDLLHDPELYAKGSLLTKRTREYLRAARAAHEAAKAAKAAQKAKPAAQSAEEDEDREGEDGVEEELPHEEDEADEEAGEGDDEADMQEDEQGDNGAGDGDL